MANILFPSDGKAARVFVENLYRQLMEVERVGGSWSVEEVAGFREIAGQIIIDLRKPLWFEANLAATKKMLAEIDP